MKRLLLVIPLLFIFQLGIAQEKVITGTVVSLTTGDPVINASVLNRNTKKSTTTTATGRFIIRASKGDVLEISSIGYQLTTVTIGDANEVTVRMPLHERQLSEVVVTALGIRKEKRSLGTAQQEIKGDEIAETQRENFFNSIQARVAGATVNATSGAPGASSQVVLRGFNSISGNNSPLIIVDGLPLNNEVFNQHRLASDQDNRNNDFTNRAADINPDDIESVTILKGPEAAALYGTEAGSGAIIITTKKGRAQPMKISYDNNFRFEKITRFHKVQRIYDLGTNGAPSTGVRGFFGPRYAPGTVFYDNLENFFETGNTHRHTLSAEGGNKSITYRWSGTYSDQHGVIPNTRYRRINSRLTIFSKLLSNLDLTATGSFANNINNKAFRGAGGYMLNLLYWPLDDDARQYLNDDGNRKIITKLSSGSDNYGENNNAYFDVNKNINFDKLNRGGLNIQLNYDPLEWLNINVKGAADRYTQEGGYMLHPQSYNIYTVSGRIEQYTQDFASYSGTFLVTGRKKFGEFNVKLLTGTAIDDRKTEIFSRRGDSIINADQLTYKTLDVDKYTTKTKVNSRTQGRDTLVLERSLGIFGELSFDYKSMIYLNISGRNDWLAEFPSYNRSYFYPAANLSFIFSELWGESSAFPLGKFRASIAQTGKRVAPYRNQSVYTSLVSATNTYGIAYGFDNNNPDLKPERQTTVETGLELLFANNRYGLDVTYYNTYVDQQVVVGARASYGTGFILNTINAASVRNQGVEAIFRMHWIKQRNFNWRMNINASKSWNRVVSLPASLPEFYNSDTWLGFFRASLFQGYPTTTISGVDYNMTNNQGQILIDPANGYPQVNLNVFSRIGDRNPDVVFGVQNRFNYKNFNLSFLVDVKIGGDVLNATEQWLTTVGLSPRTADREIPRIYPGVLADGLQNTATPTPNTIMVTPMYQNFIYTDRSVTADFVEHDVNWLRMRDITLSYNFGKTLLNSLRFLQSGSVFLTATDLFIITNYSGVDPAVNGNTPSTGGVGSFAIDYGNTATPVGINFGIRTSFKTKK